MTTKKTTDYARKADGTMTRYVAGRRWGGSEVELVTVEVIEFGRDRLKVVGIDNDKGWAVGYRSIVPLSTLSETPLGAWLAFRYDAVKARDEAALLVEAERKNIEVADAALRALSPAEVAR